MTAALAAALTGLVVAAVWAVGPAGPNAPRHQRRTGAADVFERVGDAALVLTRRLAGRPMTQMEAPAAGAVGRGVTGFAMCAAAGVLLVPSVPWVGAVLGMVPLALVPVRRRSADQRAALDVAAELPEVIDLLALVVGAGGTVAQAVAAVGRRGSGPLAAALARGCIRADVDRILLADAMAEVPAELGPAGDPIRPLVAALADSSRHGTALGPALDRLATEARVRRRQRAEAQARRVPVLLLFPLVTCTLPALGLLTVVPLMVGSLRSLRG